MSKMKRRTTHSGYESSKDTSFSQNISSRSTSLSPNRRRRCDNAKESTCCGGTCPAKLRPKDSQQSTDYDDSVTTTDKFVRGECGTGNCSPVQGFRKARPQTSPAWESTAKQDARRPAQAQHQRHNDPEMPSRNYMMTDSEFLGSYTEPESSFQSTLDEDNLMEDTLSFTNENKEELCRYVLKNVVGYNHMFQGPYGPNYITYLDYIASGKPLACIENYIRDRVMPLYANTHTETSHTAHQTNLFREEAREIIRDAVNASEDDVVIFTGSGATSAVNKLIFALKPKNPVVFIGPYEHHSNILPWLEIESKVVKIPQTKDGLIDLNALHWQMKKMYYSSNNNRLLIGAFSAASNITGILTDVDAISKIVHRYNGLAIFDYACAAPYVDIDMNPMSKSSGGESQSYKDAVFISPHKFVGGPGTPGILIAKRHMFQNAVPHNAGGGTVNFVRRKSHRYLVDPEHREEGGTPAIIESIRAGLVFKLKMTFTPEFIMEKEEEFYNRAQQAWSQIPNLVILGNLHVARLPIFPMVFYNEATGRLIHHNFAARILNDVFGIQTRGGCACAAPYAMDLIGMGEDMAAKVQALTGKRQKTQQNKASTEPFADNGFKPGFVRLNIPFFISEQCFHFVLQAVQMVAKYCWALLPQYEFDKNSGNWTHRNFQVKTDHLHQVTFESGHLEVEHDPNSSIKVASKEIEAYDYELILKRAKLIFQNALSSSADVEDETRHYSPEEKELRWFMLPSEAASLIHGREVEKLPYSELQFFPGALARKLGVSVMGHKARTGSLDKKFPVEF